MNEPTQPVSCPKTIFMRAEDAPNTGTRKRVAVIAREAKRYERRNLERGIRDAQARVREGKRKARIAARKTRREALEVAQKARLEAARLACANLPTGQQAPA